MGVGDGYDGKSVMDGILCSICLEAVIDDGDRSWAKLHCGHHFHLDCIGSAFNVKGAMQCPNCRKIEKGQWLYANGRRTLTDFFDELAQDEDLSDSNNSEMSFGFHWCPFSGLTRLSSSFDQGEFSSNTYHDLLGHHAVFSEQTPVPSTYHPRQYISYFRPLHLFSSTSTTMSNGSVLDDSSFNSHYTGPSVPNYAFPSMDVHYHSWDHSSPFGTTTRIVAGPDHPSVASVTQRTSRTSSDIPRPAILPFILGRRGPSSITSSTVPPYPGAVSGPRERASTTRAHFQQSTNNTMAHVPVVNSSRRSSSHRASAHLAPAASSSDQQEASGFNFFPLSSSSRTFQEGENNPRSEQLNFWELEHHQPLYATTSQGERDYSSIWGPFHPPNSFHQRHGS